MEERNSISNDNAILKQIRCKTEKEPKQENVNDNVSTYQEIHRYLTYDEKVLAGALQEDDKKSITSNDEGINESPIISPTVTVNAVSISSEYNYEDADSTTLNPTTLNQIYPFLGVASCKYWKWTPFFRLVNQYPFFI